MPAGTKQFDMLACRGVGADHMDPLQGVAERTSQREVRQASLPALRSRYHVVNWKGRHLTGLRQLAVFASVGGPAGDSLTQFGRNDGHLDGLAKFGKT